MFQKRGFRLNIFIVFVLVFSMLLGFLLQRPSTLLSRRLFTVNISELDEEAKDATIDHDLEENLKNGDPEQPEEGGQNAPVSAEQLGSHEEGIHGEDLEQQKNISVKEHEVGHGGAETVDDAEQNSQFEDGEAIQEKNDNDYILRGSDQEISTGLGNAEKREEHIAERSDVSAEDSGSVPGAKRKEKVEGIPHIGDFAPEEKHTTETEAELEQEQKLKVPKVQGKEAEEGNEPHIPDDYDEQNERRDDAETPETPDEIYEKEVHESNAAQDNRLQSNETYAEGDLVRDSSFENVKPPVDKKRTKQESTMNNEEPEEMKSLLKRSDAKWNKGSTKALTTTSSQNTGKQKKNEPPVDLPPGLKPRLAHLQRSLTNPLTAPLEWKRPMMLSALGFPHGDKLILAMLSAGVDLIGFKRCFNVVGCLVGNKTYPKFKSEKRSPHHCIIDSDVPEGATISLLITRDEKLQEAIAKPLVYGDFTFEIEEEDFLKLDEKINIDKDVRALSDGYEVVAIKSNITWHEGLREPESDPKRKRYELCLMTAMRQYPFLMKQWFDYYRRVGVDQIYVYDNVSPEDLSQFDSEFVQTVFWPYGRSQYQSFNHFHLLSRNRCKYVAFFDADEYVFIGDTEPDAMKRYVKKRTEEGYDQITFPFIVMAGSGYIKRPEGSLPNLYVRRDLRQKKFHVGKTVISSDVDYVRNAVHFASGGKKRYINGTFELNPTSLEHNAMLMHYTRRSWEEFIMKTNAGGASVVTNARAPKSFTMESVPNYYMSNDSTVEYFTFRDQWRMIMEREEPKDVSLIWKTGGKECKQQYCIACSRKELIGEPLCS